VLNPLKRVLLGTPLPSSQAPHERLTKVTGLAVLSSDALSSVAYATDAMLAVRAAPDVLNCRDATNAAHASRGR
jgi:hypothetical protein